MFLKIIFTILVICQISLPSFAHPSRASFHSSLIELATASRAKDYCSCRFVMGQDKDFCLRFSKQNKIAAFFDIIKESTDEKKITVTMPASSFSNEAKYLNPKLGCVLQ